MWRKLRIAILLLFLGVAAYSNWYDRLSTTDWDETLYVGVFPIDDADNAVARDYIDAPVGRSHCRHRAVPQRGSDGASASASRAPSASDLYPPVAERPPERAAGAGILQNMWWSLKLRMYARRAARAPAGRRRRSASSCMYHDPSFTSAVPHSVGMQKGLVGVVHAFADAGMTRTNNVVIAHEILHTLGATDKYDPQTLAPLFPIGYAEPERDPLHPQTFTEIMAGRYAVDARTFEMPESLDEVVVGDGHRARNPLDRDHERTLLETAQLRVAVPGRVLVDSFDCAIRAGEFIALLGGNGAGKSLLLRTLAGLRAPRRPARCASTAPTSRRSRAARSPCGSASCRRTRTPRRRVR